MLTIIQSPKEYEFADSSGRITIERIFYRGTINAPFYIDQADAEVHSGRWPGSPQSQKARLRRALLASKPSKKIAV
jgi:hypothetical protein